MAPDSSKGSDGPDSAAGIDAAEVLARVERLRPLIEGEADQSEKDGKLTAKLVDGLHRERLFRLLLPKPYDGEEVSPPVFMQAIEAVAKLDASTAWCLCQQNGCAMTAAIAEPHIANEIWGRDPKGALAWGPGKAVMRPVSGGYSVTADLAFASGMHNATWIGAHCLVLEEDDAPRLDADGKPEIRTALIPRAQVAVTRIWDVIGLRATGSDAYKLDNFFVDDDHTVLRDRVDELRYTAPLYLFRQTSLYASGFSGVALGIARSMLDAFKKLTVEKRPRLAKTTLNENQVVQAEVALCQARLDAARTFLVTELEDIWRSVLATGDLTIDQRMRIRLATTHGIHEAKAVADMVYDAAGATAVFHSSPFERRYRDIRTVTQQMQGRKAHYQSVGNHLLGGEPDMSSA